MENAVVIKTELTVLAQKHISNFILNNTEISQQVETGIKKAFESIDIEAEIENAVKNDIRRAIAESANWGLIRKQVHEKIDTMISDLILKQTADIRKALGLDI